MAGGNKNVCCDTIRSNRNRFRQFTASRQPQINISFLCVREATWEFPFFFINTILSICIHFTKTTFVRLSLKHSICQTSPFNHLYIGIYHPLACILYMYLWTHRTDFIRTILGVINGCKLWQIQGYGMQRHFVCVVWDKLILIKYTCMDRRMWTEVVCDEVFVNRSLLEIKLIFHN